MKIRNQFALGVIAILLSACGGGGSSSSTDVAATTNPENQPVTGEGQLLTGRFVDSSAVSGLRYTTATQADSTDANGSFRFMAGESVIFSVGDITLPAVTAESVITPLAVFATDEITDVRVMNLSRLLQTLDVDGNPENGLVLSDAAIASATGLSVNFSSDAFDTEVSNLVANSGAAQVALVPGIDALENLQEALFVEGVQERPTVELTNTGGDGPATHPLVGRSVEFVTRSHDVSGTVTILDDRTIEISNFNYDGAGISVYLYNGIGQNFRTPDSQRIGPLLNNGTVYVNETFTVTLPDGLTLDDFNSISVWCEPFNVSFGDVTF
jgi:hypothetical protein